MIEKGSKSSNKRSIRYAWCQVERYLIRLRRYVSHPLGVLFWRGVGACMFRVRDDERTVPEQAAATKIFEPRLVTPLRREALKVTVVAAGLSLTTSAVPLNSRASAKLTAPIS